MEPENPCDECGAELEIDQDGWFCPGCGWQEVVGEEEED